MDTDYCKHGKPTDGDCPGCDEQRAIKAAADDLVRRRVDNEVVSFRAKAIAFELLVTGEQVDRKAAAQALNIARHCARIDSEKVRARK